MTEIQNTKFDLEERTFKFAKEVRDFLKLVKRTISNIEYGKQLIRSSASIAANYIEANEALGKKDFFLHIKISRKEAKETLLWIKLLDLEQSQESTRKRLLQEGNEIMKIFGAIVTKNN